jgi:hypothetical protein
MASGTQSDQGSAQISGVRRPDRSGNRWRCSSSAAWTSAGRLAQPRRHCWRGLLANGFNVPDGNDALRADIPAIVELIERTARWVHPDTFRALPVWAPHTARGRPLYDAAWARRYTNTRKATGLTAEKFEGNVAALNALVAALDVSSPKPSVRYGVTTIRPSRSAAASFRTLATSRASRT